MCQNMFDVPEKLYGCDGKLLYIQKCGNTKIAATWKTCFNVYTNKIYIAKSWCAYMYLAST